MRKKILRIAFSVVCVFLAAVCLTGSALAVFASEVEVEAEEYKMDINANAAILIDAETGVVLYEKNADQAYPPASVTKVMTLLLIMEAIEAGNIGLSDMVSTSEKAASMGGSQIFLEPGEQMSVEDLVKSVVIASANDAAVALAEYVVGSEEAFVSMMNARATELGMKNTCFENTNGLDDTVTNHLTSARDIAIMSAMLIKYDTILKYSSTWMDTIRNGAFGLTNTNRLVRFYDGATGLKTGSTDKAKFCISASAKRGDLHLIAVVMGAPTRDIRNEETKKLLDYGFANYKMYRDTFESIEPLSVVGGTLDKCAVKYSDFAMVAEKGVIGKIERYIELPEFVAAPVKKGDVVGRVVYRYNGEDIGENPIYADTDIAKISFLDVLERMLEIFLLRG